MAAVLLLCMPLLTACFEDNPDPGKDVILDINPKMLGGSSSSAFTPGNWYNCKAIAIYNKNTRSLDSIALPWADVTQTSMPDEYKRPDKEVINCWGKQHRWQLAFNTCDDSKVPGTDMFGLWDKGLQIMRIYVYLSEIPNQNASTCYMQVTTVGKLCDDCTVGWMPSDSLQKVNWEKTMNDDKIPTPAKGTLLIPPVSGELTGALSPGWICFELKFTGLSNCNTGDVISISMQSVSRSDTRGTAVINGTVAATDSSYITVPGSKLKEGACIVNAFGDLFSSISSTIAGTINSESALVGVFGGIGAAVSLAGGIMNGVAAGKDSKYKLHVSFNVNEKADINMTTISEQGTTLPSCSMYYRYMFGHLLNTKADDTDVDINLGVWNMKNNPVVYVCEDALFYNDKNGSYYADYDGLSVTNEMDADENLRYITFLDPTSLQVMLNQDVQTFPYDSVESVRLLAYDFVFCDDSYTLPAKPFFDFYNMTRKDIKLTTQTSTFIPVLDGDDKSMRLVECSDKDLLLDSQTDIDYRTRNSIEITNDNNYVYKYGGIASSMKDEFASYNVVYSPIVYVPRNNTNSYNNLCYLENIGVSVVLELTIKGKKFIYAERFLPRFQTFKQSDVAALKSRLSGATCPTTVDGKTVENPLFDQQIAKAVRILDKLQ